MSAKDVILKAGGILTDTKRSWRYNVYISLIILTLRKGHI